MKRPQNRKLMIRDLPASAAYLLHPSLRGILQSRPKRWNSGSPSHRIAVNLVRKYKKQIKPRVLPFFCDHCRISSRYFSIIKDHECDKEDKKKAARKEEERKYSDYDCTNEARLAMNAEKQWRFNALASLEQSLKPNVIMPKKVEISKFPTEAEPLDCEPDQAFLEAKKKEFEDDIPHHPIEEVLIENTQAPRPPTTVKPDPREAGVFCFNCKGSFESYSQYHLHLFNSHDNGACSKVLPSYYPTETIDRSGLFDPRYKHKVMHSRPSKRDVRHVRCTHCKTINFTSTAELYAHMINCANSVTQDSGNSPPRNFTSFGYGLPPSHDAYQYVFPETSDQSTPRKKKGTIRYTSTTTRF
ncbi:hypothetical protein L3Y34_017799 [Caenorhabditis briggsae]|uniref:Uncharacterized protein n=2 Tax=Caenorhabditis briggsae TaxID=6238 RepID=A0AAE9DIS1_CAEBR|nr:hypothetical protein L3Y34_017799 [Caenorhabditis briggsae]